MKVRGADVQGCSGDGERYSRVGFGGWALPDICIATAITRQKGGLLQSRHDKVRWRILGWWDFDGRSVVCGCLGGVRSSNTTLPPQPSVP
ncbi:hypothetical protein BKG89_04615 [Rodentibacter caecimuris]|uniref:Uncharacterized protein n=1 Tax=Rodentibacter caecimuris TaxID=1796644 RepID=A0ABX3KXJ2_9PAST|nr:hypothetical protein BKG89_04615 [Rodentibacter heylii]